MYTFFTFFFMTFFFFAIICDALYFPPGSGMCSGDSIPALRNILVIRHFVKKQRVIFLSDFIRSADITATAVLKFRHYVRKNAARLSVIGSCASNFRDECVQVRIGDKGSSRTTMNVMHTLHLSPGAYCDRNVPLIASSRASNLAREYY